VLHQQYAGRRRPRTHYTLGRLPQWVARAGRLGPTASRLADGPLGRVAKAVAGVDARRSLPRLAPVSLLGLDKLDRRGVALDRGEVDVWIWADTFTDRFLPQNAQAAIRVLAAAGLRAAVVPESACCGLTWLTTGQLDQARARVEATVRTLAPYAASAPVIGLEPSCLAVLRSDAAELTDTTVEVRTLAELLEGLDWQPPDLIGTRVVAQPHCHHASVLGWAADQRLLERAGADVVRVAGCCGLAGNFGMERGHYEVSVAVAETHLLPTVRANPGAVVLADGLSCRHQLADLEGVSSMHLAELLASKLEA